MTTGSMAALFGALVLLAAAPSLSVMLVSATSASSGFVHGASAAMGVVAGDLVFILLAVFGLALLAESGALPVFVHYVAAAYLAWLGLRRWRSVDVGERAGNPPHASLRGSFMAGLLLTLADQKAVLFYLAFLPAFLDLGALTRAEIGTVMLITILAVGGVKLGYAYAGDRAGAFLGPGLGGKLNRVAATIMLLGAAMSVVLARQ